MQIGRWYDPIERKWHEPKPTRPPFPSSNHETSQQEGYRIAAQNRLWEAIEATARASQQVDNRAD